MSRSEQRVIGVTGNLASGKSTVMRRLAHHGAMTIDADAVYHGLIAPGAKLWQALRHRFGDDIIAVDGAIDRRALAAIVFSNQAALADLDQITHPSIVNEIRRQIQTANEAVVAVDAVKLFESSLASICDQVWIVTSSPEQQVARLIDRNSLSLEDARRRVTAQPAIKPKLQHANTIIDNTGSIEATHDQVDAAWRTLFASPEN